MRIPMLMLVTQKSDLPLANYLDFIQVCVSHGVDAVQLREKNLTPSELLIFGKALKQLLSIYRVPLIVNDNIKLCLALNADGVHLGQQDECSLRARKILGADKLIGLTVDTLEQAKKANDTPVNYIGVGTIFPTRNKSNITTTWGIEGLAAVKSVTRHPIIAIGGIDETNTPQVIQTGVHGIAAIGAFHDSTNPALTTQTLKHQLTGDHHVSSM